MESQLQLTIPKRQLAETISHAYETDPEECCGVLFGRDGTILLSRPIPNVHRNKISRYMMDPLVLLQAEREADTRGEQLTAIYHSHTYSQAYPSEIDTKNAVESGWTDPFYVLISLVEKTRPVVRAFKITDDGQVSEVPIKTDGEQYIGGYLSDDTKSN